MRTLSHTKAIFQQLRATDGATGVKTIIENHDAWLHNEDVRAAITIALRTQLTAQRRPDSVQQRIAAQRDQLARLATRLPLRLCTAG
jgi:hypothetical protein